MPEPTGSMHLYLSDVSPKDKPWDKHRKDASAVQALYRGSEFQRYADRIHECSQQLLFAFQANDSGEFAARLRQARFCRVPRCPVCQWRRTLKWRAKFFRAVPKVREAYPSARWMLLTLTVKNCPVEELRATLGQMNKAWNRMVLRKQFPAIGFVKSTEVTRGEDGWAHPHFHCLLLASGTYFSGKQYVTQAQWAELWKHALRIDYTPIVDVRAVKPRPGGEGDPVAIGILETLKYTVKQADLVHDAEWLHEITRQLHKTRAVSVGGVLRSFIDDNDRDEDLINIDEENVESESTGFEVLFGWRELYGRYVKE